MTELVSFRYKGRLFVELLGHVTAHLFHQVRNAPWKDRCLSKDTSIIDYLHLQDAETVLGTKTSHSGTLQEKKYQRT